MRCWAEKKEVGRSAVEKKERGRGELGREGQGDNWAGWGFSLFVFIFFSVLFLKPFLNKILNANKFKPEANNTK